MLTEELRELKDAIVEAIADEIGPTAPAARPKMPPEIAKAVVTVKGQIERLSKDAKNPHGNYRYTSVDDFFEAVGHIMAEAGIFCIPHEVSAVVERREATDDRGNSRASNWLTCEYDLVLYHESGVEFGPMRRRIAVIASGPQAYGSAASYIEKQFLRSLFKIPTGDTEADEHDQKGLPDNRRSSPPPRKEPAKYGEEDSAAARDRMLKEIAALPMVERDLLHWANVNNAETFRMLDPDEQVVSEAYFAKQAAIRGQPKPSNDLGEPPF